MSSDSDLARMSRSRLYVLIDAFERDIRRIMQRYVLAEMSEQTALGDLYNKAIQRQASDSAAEVVPSSVELRWRPGEHQAALTV